MRLKEASREGSKVRNCGILVFRGWLWNDLEDLQYWNVFLGLVLFSGTGDHMLRVCFLELLDLNPVVRHCSEVEVVDMDRKNSTTFEVV